MKGGMHGLPFAILRYGMRADSAKHSGLPLLLTYCNRRLISAPRTLPPIWAAPGRLFSPGAAACNWAFCAAAGQRGHHGAFMPLSDAVTLVSHAWK